MRAIAGRDRHSTAGGLVDAGIKGRIRSHDTFGIGGSDGGWSTDIAGVRVQHLPRRIVVTTTFDDLSRWSDFDVSVDSHAGPAVDYRFHIGGGGAGALYRGWNLVDCCYSYANDETRWTTKVRQG